MLSFLYLSGFVNFFHCFVAMLVQTLQNILFFLRKKLKQMYVCLSNMLLKIRNQILHAQGMSY